jgi:hypothetical protein
MVCLLHFSIPYPNRRHVGGVQHYVGYTHGWIGHLRQRLAYHASGRGSKFLAAVFSSGRTVVVARKWKHGDRGLERRLKERHGGAPPLCPLCSGRSAYKLMRYSV